MDFDLGNLDWGQIASGFATPGMKIPDRVPAMPQSPIAPEALAANMAARGLPPPAQDLAPQGSVGAALTGTEPPPYRLAGPEAMDKWRQGVDATSVDASVAGVAPTGVAAKPGVGAPLDITPKGVDGPTDVSASKKADGKGGFAEALRGVKAPAGPELQRLGTPAAPRMTGKIQGGQLMALLQALNAAPGAESRKLPTTLPQSFGRG